MTARDEALARLEELQRRFGAALRQPLARDGGVLRVEPARYDDALLAALAGGAGAGHPAAARLAVYHRQYWFRLFGAMQHELPLTAAVLGAWAFNAVAARFLAAHPPRRRELARVADGFGGFAAAAAAEAARDDAPAHPAPPPDAVAQAAAIDDAFRRAFAAPARPQLRLGPSDAARLAGARLRQAPWVGVVAERWPLVALRDGLPAQPASAPVALPPPHADGPRSWLVCRTDGGPRAIPLAPGHARLLRLLDEHPLATALGRLEAECPADQRPALAAAARRWLADGMALGLWLAAEEAA